MKPSPFNWWKLYHDAMSNLPWASPDAIRQLTIPQLLCLACDRPPSAGPVIRNAEEYEAFLDRRAEAERKWHSN